MKMAGGRDELRERQEDELEVIKAIYVGDVEEVVKAEGQPLEFKVRLLPQKGSSAGTGYGEKVPTFVVLNVCIPLDYPKRAPTLTISDRKGLSDKEVIDLEMQLKDMSSGLVKNEEEMIYQLLTAAETYLHTHQRRSIGSFHDEMMLRQRQQEESQMQKQIDLKEKERLALKEEIQRKQQEEKEEIRKLREKRAQFSVPLVDDEEETSSPLSSPVKGDGFSMASRGRAAGRRKFSAGARRALRSNSEGSDSSASEADITMLEFVCGKNTTLFYKGEVLGKSPRGTTVYAGMSRSGSLVALTEWKFITKLDKGDGMSLEDAMKLVHNFEVEMNLLQKLEHPNLVHYFGIKSFSPVDETGVFYVYLAEEFVRGTSLQAYLQGKLTFDLALVRHCAKGILEGIKYLHDSDIVHRFMRETSIFLDTSGIVRLTDYGLERKICELYQTFHQTPEVPDLFPASIGRGGKKCDIFRFGVILLSLVSGEYVKIPPEIPSMLPLQLQDFIRKCITPLEHSRWSAAELLDHSFLKVPLPTQVNLTFPCAAKNGEQPKKTSPEDDQEDNDESDDLPQALPNLFRGHSRVQNEFEILKFLGKGGFGDVLKVKNKLDGRMYALKRIKLNPKNKQLNKKITREVKLLSQLNHENVVRYFNSWIETVIESDDEVSTNTESLSTEATQPGRKALPTKAANKRGRETSLGIYDDFEAMAPPMPETSDWSTSGFNKSHRMEMEQSSEESEESSDDEDLFGTSFRRITMGESSSGEIVFENSESSQVSDGTPDTRKSVSVSKQDVQKTDSVADDGQSSQSIFSFLRESQFLYIQMEFCEKSTLRTAIDTNLCEDLDRAWRLFREIVEGLFHIHQQGMIHRDLKPVNIFLDVNDHVKIGDFGLATSSILPKRTEDEIDGGPSHGHQSLDFTDETQTGQVGTALYVAPELMVSGGKASYNQKVDIYSLGVMFFEMFYHPPGTTMERIRVIMGLRQPTVSFPADFDESVFPQVTHITRWLLDHDHTKRPTSLELLQSDYLPPPHVEEAELRDLFTRTLRSSKTKSYKYLIASCFQQKVSAVEAAAYDVDGGKCLPIAIPSVPTTTGILLRNHYILQRVNRIVCSVFERHGATELHTPLLMPKSSLYSDIDTLTSLMCHSGQVVSIPHDLRIPFARYVGRYGFNHFKRFTIGKVFRERKVHGLHPRELFELAFDCVDSYQGSLISDAEVISIVFEIVAELPWLRNKNYVIRLGHTKLLKGFMLHHAVDEKLHDTITKLLSETRNERDSKQQIQTHLCSLELSDHFVTTLLHLLDVEGPFSKISGMLKGIMKRKGEAASCIKEGLHELEVLISNLESFGVKCNISVIPAMTFCPHIYSGLLFQVVCDLKRRKNKLFMDVIAAGGRYDQLIREYRTSMYLDQDGHSSTKDIAPCGVGISISLDKLLSGFEIDEEDAISMEWGGRGSVDVIICGMGHHPMVKEKIDMLKDLLAHGIRASVLDQSQTLESAEEICKEIGALFLVILKEGEYFSNIRVRLWERGRFNEKKLNKPEVIEFISKTLMEGKGSSDAGLIRSDMSVKQSIDANFAYASSSHTHHGSSTPLYNISIIIQEREKVAHTKRKYENQVMSRIGDTLSKFGKQQMVEIVGVELNSNVVNSLASTLSLHDKEEFTKCVVEVIEKHPGMKKYLKLICDDIFEIVYKKHASVLIIFGLLDNSYRVLL